MANRLEAIEWTQYWTENHARELPCILMVGDSISVGYRSAVYQRVKEKYNCVTISSSKAIDNSSIMREIEFIANEEGFEYPVVHFNNGLHGGHVTAEDYEKYYREAIEFLKEKFPSSRIILATSTPVTENGKTDTYAPFNADVIKRNEIVFALAKEYGLEVDDLYAAVEGHPEYRSADGYHYNGQGYEALADVIVGCIGK